MANRKLSIQLENPHASSPILSLTEQQQENPHASSPVLSVSDGAATRTPSLRAHLSLTEQQQEGINLMNKKRDDKMRTNDNKEEISVEITCIHI